ncbi:MAG: LPXTG cell wall anchor domain-containing protein [Clostridium paraputrificum]
MLPVTGGAGTIIFTVGGLSIMAGAIFLYMKTMRKTSK